MNLVVVATVPVADGIEMQLFYVPAHVSGNERERDLCVLYLNLIARLAAQICQEQTGDSKRKWKDEGPGTVGHKQLKLTVTLLSIVRKCTAVCAATVALWH